MIVRLPLTRKSRIFSCIWGMRARIAKVEKPANTLSKLSNKVICKLQSSFPDLKGAYLTLGVSRPPVGRQ